MNSRLGLHIMRPAAMRVAKVATMPQPACGCEMAPLLLMEVVAEAVEADPVALTDAVTVAELTPEG